MSKRFMSNSISNQEVPKLSYDPVSKRSNIYDVERALDSFVQQNYVTLYDSISSKVLKTIKKPKILSLSASADTGAAPTVLPPLKLSVLADPQSSQIQPPQMLPPPLSLYTTA
jgi:hypothetical protein